MTDGQRRNKLAKASSELAKLREFNLRKDLEHREITDRLTRICGILIELINEMLDYIPSYEQPNQ